MTGRLCPIPDNFMRLHDHEETLRQQAIEEIEKTADLVAHMHMIEQSTNVFFDLLPSNEITDKDELTVANLPMLAIPLDTQQTGVFHYAR